jgi:hypothetical protein
MKHFLNFKRPLYYLYKVLLWCTNWKAQRKLCIKYTSICFGPSVPNIRKVNNKQFFSIYIYIYIYIYICICIYIYTHTHTHIHTQTSLLSYLIWACNHGYTVWKRSAFVCLMLEIGKKVVIATDRFCFGPLKEKRHSIMANHERKCYYIDILDHTCDNVTHFKVLIKKTGIF